MTAAEIENELSLAELLSEPDPARRWAKAYGALRPLRIEIGVGKSEFLIQVCLQEPGFNYLGFEYSPKRVANFLRQVELRGIRSIRMLRANASMYLSTLVAPASVDRFFVNFPDPWPKRRHTKHRLIQEPLAAILERLLLSGGGISLRSDDPSYAAEMRRVLDGTRGLTNLAGPGRFAVEPRDAIPTLYEQKFRQEGRSIHYLEYRKGI